VVIKKGSLEKSQSSFETPAYQDISLGTEELNLIGSCRIAEREEFGDAKKTSCVI
jgi:hypothetical protein